MAAGSSVDDLLHARLQLLHRIGELQAGLDGVATEVARLQSEADGVTAGLQQHSTVIAAAGFASVKPRRSSIGSGGGAIGGGGGGGTGLLPPLSGVRAVSDGTALPSLHPALRGGTVSEGGFMLGGRDDAASVRGGAASVRSSARAAGGVGASASPARLLAAAADVAGSDAGSLTNPVELRVAITDAEALLSQLEVATEVERTRARSGGGSAGGAGWGYDAYGSGGGGIATGRTPVAPASAEDVALRRQLAGLEAELAELSASAATTTRGGGGGGFGVLPARPATATPIAGGGGGGMKRSAYSVGSFAPGT